MLLSTGCTADGLRVIPRVLWFAFTN